MKFEDVLELDSGLLIPSGGALGKVLASDASGNATWANHGPDNIQPGVLGLVNPGVLSATLPGTTSLSLTFTNWPTGDVVWFNVSNQYIRGVLPAGTGLVATSGGGYSHTAIDAVPPTTPGGTCTLIASHGTFNEGSAALAAANQAALTAGNVRIWDGIVLDSGGNFTLVTANGGSPGMVFNTTSGRDRRPWARGFHFYGNPGGPNAVAATPAWYQINSGQQVRVEVGQSELLHLRLEIGAYTDYGSSYGHIGWLIDGVGSEPDQIMNFVNAGAYTTQCITCEGDLVIASGSYLIAPAWLPYTYGNSTLHNDTTFKWNVDEIIHPSTTNGTS